VLRHRCHPDRGIEEPEVKRARCIGVLEHGGGGAKQGTTRKSWADIMDEAEQKELQVDPDSPRREGRTLEDHEHIKKTLLHL
jgi:hypothetical protein